jgi:hypothetical protein
MAVFNSLFGGDWLFGATGDARTGSGASGEVHATTNTCDKRQSDVEEHTDAAEHSSMA